MKLNNVEINGYDHVVICKDVVFVKRDDGRWQREGSHKPDIIEHCEMVNKIKKFTYSPYHRVWINGTYINVYPSEY